MNTQYDINRVIYPIHNNGHAGGRGCTLSVYSYNHKES